MCVCVCVCVWVGVCVCGGGGCSWLQFSDFLCFLQVSEAILDNARLMLQTENVQANAEDFKDRSLLTL